MLAIMRADIYATFLKVVNDRGEIIAAAKWNIYDRVLPPEFDVDGSYWKDDEEKEYAQHMFRMYLAPRCKAIKESGGPLVCEYFKGVYLAPKLRVNNCLSFGCDDCAS
jgi:hypothetical protein